MQEQRFIADRMLGRLAKWLRILGYDTLYDPHWHEVHLVRLARADDRILLTRDVRTSRRRGVRTLFVESGVLEEQLDQLHLVLGVHALAPWTRCPICNEELLAISKDQAWGQVPPYVFVKQQEFRLCPQCDRFYWQGTHRERMQAFIAGWEKDASAWQA